MPMLKSSIVFLYHKFLRICEQIVQIHKKRFIFRVRSKNSSEIDGERIKSRA